ncbi:MAG: hypothetical protein KUG78_21390, partial [Kangiellaceae bacterium]|nr:hypothetical protein [Kangiellaceae bacterium]
MKTYLLTSILVVLVACGGGGSKQDPTSITPPESKRDWLTTDELFENKIPAGPIHNDYFVEIDNSEVIVSDAEHEFSGRLTLSSSSLEGSVSDAFFGEPGIRVFPNIDLEFISDSGNLIPTQRQILKPTNNSYWHILISPGKTWSEDDDGDWSRAAFPFTLIHKQRNEAHNGVATFLYNQAQVSQLRLQVVQETASWSRIDLWAQFPMTYQPEVFDSAETIISKFQLEESGRLPTASWDELSQQVGASTLVGFNSGLIESDISMTGIVMDGIVYHQPCYTRFGNYPFCHQMRQGAFSTTKSMGAAIAMFRLAEKYGDSVFELLIKDYVNVTAPHDGWDNVTFADALNMSTGIG